MERLEREPCVGDDAEVGRKDAADLLRRDVDLHERTIAAVDVERTGMSIAEPRADGDHQIALQEKLIGKRLAGLDADRPCPQRMILANRTLSHQGRCDRYVQPLGQAHQCLGGVGDDDAAAGEDQRSLRRLEHLDRAGDRGRRRLDRADRQPRVGSGVVGDRLGALHVQRQVDQHRPGPP